MPKLDDPDRVEFQEVARNLPSEAEYDQPAWTTDLAQWFLKDSSMQSTPAVTSKDC